MSDEQVVLFYANDNDLIIEGLELGESGAAIGDATITADILDSDGSAISGGSSLTISVENADDGKYRGRMESSASLTIGQTYTIRFTVSKDSYNAEFNIPARCERRGAT